MSLTSDQIKLASTPDAPAVVANCNTLVAGDADAFKYFLVEAFTVASVGILMATASSPTILAVAANPDAVPSSLYVEVVPAATVSSVVQTIIAFEELSLAPLAAVEVSRSCPSSSVIVTKLEMSVPSLYNLN